jgi:hypothetical protein
MVGDVDTTFMTEGTDRLGLSHRQKEFAERMDCRMAMRCVDESVCFYRVVAHETIRWIVDTNGSVLDWSVFRSGI